MGDIVNLQNIDILEFIHYFYWDIKMSNLNAVDFIVLLILAFSTIMGIMRGFLKEIISVVSWVAAAFVAMTFASPVAAHFSGGAGAAAQSAVGSSVNVAQPVTVLTIGISFLVLFVGTLFIGSIVGYLFSGAGTASGLGFFNRILGAGFGLVRGYVMVIIFMFVAELTPMGGLPEWTQSQFVKSFQPTVQWFGNLVQPGLDSLKALGASAVQSVGGSNAAAAVSGAFHSATGK